MYNRGPGSLRGDDKIDLANANRMLERSRNRIQDNYSGNEATMRAQHEAAEAERMRKDAARLARQQTGTSLGERIHGWWSRRFHRS